jgi:hypothetical protein
LTRDQHELLVSTETSSHGQIGVGHLVDVFEDVWVVVNDGMGEVLVELVEVDPGVIEMIFGAAEFLVIFEVLDFLRF